jgi:hypothetical protein
MFVLWTWNLKNFNKSDVFKMLKQKAGGNLYEGSVFN